VHLIPARRENRRLQCRYSASRIMSQTVHSVVDDKNLIAHSMHMHEDQSSYLSVPIDRVLERVPIHTSFKSKQRAKRVPKRRHELSSVGSFLLARGAPALPHVQ
jgi:hypothetical protein